MFEISDDLKRHYAKKTIVSKKYNVSGIHKYEIPGHYAFDVEGEIFCVSKEDVEQMIKKQITLLKDYPFIESDKRVAILVESYFIYNNSGIYTFIKYLAKMLDEMGYVLDILSNFDNITERLEDFETKNISFFALPLVDSYDKDIIFNIQMEKKLNIENSLLLTFKDYLSKIKPSVIFSNGFDTTKVIVQFEELLQQMEIKYFMYTHIGDIISLDMPAEILDFSKWEVIEHLELLEKTKIPIATQTEGIASQLKDALPENTVTVLPEPFYGNKIPFSFTVSKRVGVVYVGSCSARKNVDKILEVVALSGLPLTIISSFNNAMEKRDLKEKAFNYGVQSIQILDKIPNKYIPVMINRHRCLIHLSDIEILPYSLVEAADSLPCIINGNANWAKDFIFDEMIKVDPDDLPATVSTLLEVYGDPFVYPLVNMENYSEECLNAWKEYIEVGY